MEPSHPVIEALSHMQGIFIAVPIFSADPEAVKLTQVRGDVSFTGYTAQELQFTPDAFALLDPEWRRTLGQDALIQMVAAMTGPGNDAQRPERITCVFVTKTGQGKAPIHLFGT